MLRRCAVRLLPSVTADDVAAAFRVLGLSYTPAHDNSSSSSSSSKSKKATTTHGAAAAAAAAAVRPTLDEVRQRYRELARLHHPDLGGGDDTRMKVINTAYELLQSSGVLHDGAAARHDAQASSSSGGNNNNTTAQARQPFRQRAGTRRRCVPDDFANGDDATWAMKSELDWRSLVYSTATLTEQELRNPANHPFSHSKFFNFDDDVAIYRMLRGGATVRQVARTLGMSATFVEKRLQNAQFRNRIQYVLRAEKRDAVANGSTTSRATTTTKTTTTKTRNRSDNDTDEAVSTAAPTAPDMTRRLLRYAPHDDGSDHAAAAAARLRKSSHASRPQRVREWHATLPSARAPAYFATMTLEEKGRYAKLLRDEAGGDSSGGGMSSSSATTTTRRPVASSLGRSYHNYARLRPRAST